MKAGGIFGASAMAGLGEDGTTYCSAATSLGIQDRRAGKANAASGIVSRLGLKSSSADAYLQNCYTQGYEGGLAKETGWASDLEAKAYELLLQQIAGGAKPGSSPTDATAYGPSPDTGAGKQCTDQSVIMSVQAQLGVNADGKWGPLSQAALDKLGKKFMDFAPSCQGQVPYYGGKSGGTTTISPNVLTSDIAPQVGSSSRLTSSPVFWAVALAVGIGGYLYFSGNGKKGSSR